jgi:hypothetical protein
LAAACVALPLEVSGTTAQLAAIRRAKIAAVKSVNI